MELERIRVEELNAASYNPRIDLKPGDPAYESLKRSVDTFGCVQPIIVNRRGNVVVGGHQRLTVLADLGHKEVDVVFVDLSRDHEKALNVALNKITGAWDEPKLATLLQEFEGFPDVDVQLTGFDHGEIGDLITRMLDRESAGGNDDGFDADAVLDEQRPAVTQPGDLIELGEHRLLCGDSTTVDDVRRLMNGNRAVLFATDPPYLVNYDGTNHPGSQPGKNKNWGGTYGISWDDADANPTLYEDFYRVAVAEAIAINAPWYCWHASKRQAMVEEVWHKFGAFVHQQILWMKDRPVLNRSWYLWQHEPCFFGWVRPNQPDRVADNHLSTVWQVPTAAPGLRTDHPTSKPVELFAIPMRQHTRRGDLCYEPFCGSGSQLIAAEQLGRRCFALEISPHYCDVIVRRWIHFVGEANTPGALADRYRRTMAEEVTV